MTTFIMALLTSLFFLFNTNDKQTLQTSENKEQAQAVSPDYEKIPKDSSVNNERSAIDNAFQQSQLKDQQVESVEGDGPNSFNKSQPTKKSTKNRSGIVNDNNQRPGVTLQGGKNEMSCDWPSDTIVDGSKLEVLLSNDELSKLGFMINETGVYYKNRFRNKTACFHDRFEDGDGEMTNLTKSPNQNNKKEHYSTHDFYPVFMTDFLYHPGLAVDGNPEVFGVRRDTLVPVRIQARILGNSDTDIIMWFIPTPNFFNALPAKYRHLHPIYSCLRAIKKRTGRSEIVRFRQKSLIRITQFVEPDKETLLQLGFEFDNDKIIYKQRGKTCFFMVTISKFSQSIHVKDEEVIAQDPDLNLVFLSDTVGRQNIKWACRSSTDKNKHNRRNFEKLHDLLVPVKLRKQNYPDLLSKDLIFWFEPSEALFNALPSDLGERIKQEYESIVSEPNSRKENSSSCTFFETCRSTLHLDAMRLFPNPAQDQLSLHFNLHKEQFGSISLLTMGGIRVKELLSDAIIFPGKNTYEFDISGVPSGIYLLSIMTSEGFKTQRVIVQK
ncbi:T9SS type A sorting domain-containing protein [Fulvivirgaceae bacterium BMA12]|uniref:T9SS type A sorting domain-containing protein n=1 Tax=Agaribacillus aureus TaxID=3051825 RepID=A0ABT8LA76_9BACT|nr:T9SS type A sorting domain-containing protein [Fulvivirgaceae bacterium BMA12]